MDPGKHKVNKRHQVRPTSYKRKLRKVLPTSLPVSVQEDTQGQRGETAECIFDHDGDSMNDYIDVSDSDTPTNMLDSHEHITQGTTQKDRNEGGNEGMSDDMIEQCDTISTRSPKTSDQQDSHSEDSADIIIEIIKQKENVTIENLLGDLDREIDLEQDETDICEDKSDEEDETVDDHTNENTPVQPGHFMTIRTSVLLIWIYVMTHSLSSIQVADLLSLINLHLVCAHPVLGSMYRFKNFFGKMNIDAVKHFYCRYCLSPVTEGQSHCSNQVCGKELSDKNSTDYFIEMNVISQLQTFFTRKDFRDGLGYRFERSKKKNDNIEDVFDSNRYRRLFDNDGPLSNPNNVSFTFNTDGVPIFKSSKTSIWPIFLMVNELPYKMRKSREYMLLAGLWCGQSKPAMNLFLDPLFKTFDKLEKGVPITKNGNETTRAFLLGVSCDIPARSAVLNMNQHNGESCCIKCTQTGKNHRTPTGGNIRIFPYNIENPTGPTRTHESVVYSAREAMDSRSRSTHINGIKGPSVVMFCREFDTVKNVAVDYMHLVCLGVVRLLLKLWFDVSHSLNIFSLYRYVEVVDSRLVSIKLPHFINRQPRSISEHLKFWKAAELRSWLFYYAIPCTRDLMRPEYFYHFCAFVEAIFLLCKSSISDSDIENSERLLKYVVFMFQSLYGERYLTINVHSLLHLPTTVRELGPLWSHSCFAFEDANGELMKLFHGTQYIDMQIINAVHVFQVLPTLVCDIKEDNPIYKYVEKLGRTRHKLSTQFAFLGKPCVKTMSEKEKHVLYASNTLDPNVCSLHFYSRASVRGVTYHSELYTRVSKRNSYTVKFLKNSEIFYGFIQWFAEPSVFVGPAGIENFKFAYIRNLSSVPVNIFDKNHDNVEPDNYISDNFMDISLPHVHIRKMSEEFSVVRLQDIIDLCICIKMSDCLIIFEEPNHQEKNL